MEWWCILISIKVVLYCCVVLYCIVYHKFLTVETRYRGVEYSFDYG